MYTIAPFSTQYSTDLKRFAQELRNFLTSLDGRLDNPRDYDVGNEVKESIEEFEAGKNMIFICEENNKAHGYILVKYRDEDWEGTSLKKYGKVEELYVESSFRGNGASTALMFAAEEHLRSLGVQYMELSVMAGNSRARAFYEKMGLVEHKITLAKRLDT